MSRSGNEARHESVAAQLREEAPRLDDLRRARLERRVLARARGAAVSQGTAPVVVEARPSASRHLGLGALALAAAALVGFVVRGAFWPEPGAETPRFAIGSAFETREGALREGARIELARGEEGRLEIGDVSASLRDGSAIEVRSTDLDDVRLVLDRGVAELSFHPRERGRQHLRIATPSADVEVVGTVFTVAVDARGTTVSVREGTVRVTGRVDGASVLVNAGGAVTVPPVRTASAVQTPGESHATAPSAASAEEAAAPAAEAAATGQEATPPAPAPREGRAASRTGTTVSTGPAVMNAAGSAVPPAAAVAATGDVGAPSAAHSLGDPRTDGEVGAAGPRPTLADLMVVHPPSRGLDSWAAHRPSSREVADAWHDIDELQARGQFERSLELLVRLEQYAPPSDQDEALFDRARTVQEAVRRPRAARALYTAYVRRFPAGRHIQEVRRRLETLGGPAPPEPDTDGTVSDEPTQVEPAQVEPAQVEPAQVEPERDAPLDAR
jgi:ferric-dicitrate binding protein FerR (iron transport regulator)